MVILVNMTLYNCMTLTTSSSPPLNHDIYSHVICISLDLLTTGEFCASVNDFRIDKYVVIVRMIILITKFIFITILT